MSAFLKSFVSAPAGSGKTSTIVQRYLHEIALGKSPDEIVTITFTRRAAAELIERIGQVLRHRAGLANGHADGAAIERIYGSNFHGTHGAATLTPDRALAVLPRLPFAPVSTIDSFVQRLLGEHLMYVRLDTAGANQPYLDGPIEAVSTGDDWFEAAAREVLTEIDAVQDAQDDRGWLLTQMELGAACASVARLARYGDGVALHGSIAVGSTLFRAAVAEGIPEAGRGQTADQVFAKLGRLPAGGDQPAVFKSQRLAALLVMATELGIRGAADGLSENSKDPWGEWRDDWSLEQQSGADRLRHVLWTLSREARVRAASAFASAGCAPHEELLRAATLLCTSAREVPALAGLRKRYSALLVDEVQDTSPGQLAFYRAFVAMPDKPMSALYVGDGRQSIYRFRGADYHGWKSMYAAAVTAERTELTANYRSRQPLVKFCKLLVAKIREDRAHALDGVDAVTAARGDDNAIPAAESPWDTPVWIVKSSKSNVAANRAIAGFVERLNRCWSERSDRPETAAVLTSSWARARSAVDQLQRHGLKAQLSGLSQLLETREARDVTQLLRALLDPSDDIAWMGLLKHPSIGVSDRMLMELKPFGRSMLGPDGEDHFPAVPDPDGVRLRNARGILRTASNQLGHGRTSEALEEVLRALCWREIIEAGPEQREGVADLDLILDVIADAESEGVDPHAVLEVLEGTSDSRDLPNRRFATGARVVEVTTLHQSKGLEFDHVCLPWFDFSSKGSDRQSVPVDVLRLGAQTVVSVKLDPQGGITPSRDPASALFAALESTENKFESDRKVYVAATRAKETVVIGYQPPKDEDTRNAAKSLHELLGDEAQPGAQAGELSNVAYLFDGDAAQMVEGGPALSPPAIRGNPRPYSRGAACQPVDLPALASTSLLSPSHYAGPHARARAVQANFLEHRQRSSGGAPGPLPGLGGGFDQRTRGDVVHGWFEHWRFAGIATTESAQSYLDANWPRLAEQPGLAEALAALGMSVLAIPGAGALLCERGASLDFETGLVASLDEDLLVGRADLIIRHPDGWVSVVDFKGGWGEANAGEGPLQNELGYALQLGTYVAMLEAAGKRVRSIALLYAGSGDLLTCAL